MPEFEKLGVKVIALSCNSVNSHRDWIEVWLFLSMYHFFKRFIREFIRVINNTNEIRIESTLSYIFKHVGYKGL